MIYFYNETMILEGVLNQTEHLQNNEQALAEKSMKTLLNLKQLLETNPTHFHHIWQQGDSHLMNEIRLPYMTK